MLQGTLIMADKASFKNEAGGQRRLMRALRSKPNDEACQACLSQLDEYIAAQLAGEDYVARFANVAAHLDACLDCAGAYARLYELELADAANRLPQPDQLPDPDLAFLRHPAAESLSPTTHQASLKAPDLAQQLRHAMRRPGERLTLQLSADLLALLRPSPTALLTRAPADTERYGEILLSLEPAMVPDLDIPITLTAYRDAQQPEMCLVEAVVEPAGRSWPDLGGIRVTLLLAGEKHEAISDAWGVASFEGVRINDLADMALEVTLTD
jgi:hypothetical protein